MPRFKGTDANLGVKANRQTEAKRRADMMGVKSLLTWKSDLLELEEEDNN